MARIRPKPKFRLRVIRFVLTAFIALLWVCCSIPVTAQVNSSESLLRQSQTLYQSGEFDDAEKLIQQVIQQAKAQKNLLQLAIASGNLSLIYQSQGLWEPAKQTIEQSLTTLEKVPQSREKQQVLSQTQDIQAQLWLAVAQPEKALATWQQAEQLYRQLGDETHEIRVRLSQAEALQMLGLYRRSLSSLNELNQMLQKKSDSIEKAVALRSLGNALWLSGDIKSAQQRLEQSLAIAQRLNNASEIAQTLLSLGNLDREQQRFSTALAFYEQAEKVTPSEIVRVQANLNRLRLLAQTDPNSADRLIPVIDRQLKTLPIQRSSIHARINFAETLLKLKSFRQAAEILSTATQQARAIQDQRSQAYALGTLGTLYEQTQQYPEAQKLTQQALSLAQTLNAGEILYKWQWQSARLLKQQNKSEDAIVAYNASIQTLKNLRNDLAAMNRNAQFSFRDSVEPVYRQAVELLLANPTQTHLRQARSLIESLQLAELDNFFRRACLNATVLLDQIVDQQSPKAAILYAIEGSSRLDVVLKLPQQEELQHYAVSSLTQDQLSQTLRNLRQTLVDPSRVREMQTLSQQLYRWLIAPAETSLQQSGIDTLVFVLDGELRNIPMAALYDGKQYLVEKYAIVLNPGLQLINPKPLAKNTLQALAAGLINPPEPFQNLPPLPGIQAEIDSIAQAGVSTRKLLNQAFTRQALAQEINAVPFNVVHLATHGKFSSRIEETYILAYDGQIGVDQLGELLQNRGQAQSNAIELLVLSACETAAGDNRATLGLAGVALQSGARSTIASLWSVDDESTAFFIKQFYSALRKPELTKAKALQQAQIALLQEHPDYPALWSPYVLVGNWL